MASWEKGAGFRVCGVVSKAPFVRDKFARLEVAVPGRNREQKIDLVTFDAVVIGDVRQLGVGMTIQVTGAVNMESVKDKKKNPVKVDGYDKWVPLLVMKKIDVEGSSRAPAPPAENNQPAPGSASDPGW